MRGNKSSSCLHLRRYRQCSHIHREPGLADLNELVEAERLPQILLGGVGLPLLLGLQGGGLEHGLSLGEPGQLFVLD